MINICEINFAYCVNGKLTPKDIDALNINTRKSVGYTNKDGFGFFNDKCNIYKRGKEFGKHDIAQVKKIFPNSKFIISHVRFKTSGEKSARNSHPFMNGRFIWLHNGVISDYEEIAKKFGLTDAKVDSEVICGVLHHFINGGLTFRKAMQKTAQELSGSLSVFIYDKKEKKLYYFRHTASFDFRLVKVDERILIFGATDADNLKPLPYFSACYGFWKQEYTSIATKEPHEDTLYCIDDEGIGKVCDLEFKPYATYGKTYWEKGGAGTTALNGTLCYDDYGNCIDENGRMLYGANIHNKQDNSQTMIPKERPERKIESQYNDDEKELLNAVFFIEDYTWSLCGENICIERRNPELWEFVCEDSEQEVVCDEYFEKFYEPTKKEDLNKNRTITKATLLSIFKEMVETAREEEGYA